MLKARLYARFVEETLDEVARLRGLRQNLDRGDAPYLRVHRAIDFAHPAHAEKINDAVLADRLVCVESSGHV